VSKCSWKSLIRGYNERKKRGAKVKIHLKVIWNAFTSDTTPKWRDMRSGGSDIQELYAMPCLTIE